MRRSHSRGFSLSELLVVVAVIALLSAVLFPVFNWQLRTSRRIQSEQRKVAPQIQELRKKYKKEPQKLSAEMNKVYREHGISPFSGLTGSRSTEPSAVARGGDRCERV